MQRKNPKRRKKLREKEHSAAKNLTNQNSKLTQKEPTPEPELIPLFAAESRKEKKVSAFSFFRKKDERYKIVTVAKAQANPHFWLVVGNAYEEQAARVLQRAWRLKKSKSFTCKTGKSSTRKYTETLTGPLNMGFMKEAFGPKANEYATLINEGRWSELDFLDEDFVRDIYKAFRKEKINESELGTALDMFMACELFKKDGSSIKQHQFFDGKGPYHPESIPYATKEKILDFKNRLQKVSENQRCYFSIDLPRAFEFNFFETLLDPYQIVDIRSRPYFGPVIKQFLKKFQANETNMFLSILLYWVINFQINNQSVLLPIILLIFNLIKENELKQKAELYYAVDMLIKTNDADAKKRIYSFICDNKRLFPEFSKLNRIESNSVMAFIIAMRTKESFPFIAINPNYDENNPHSPLLCMIITPSSVLNKLQIAMHGIEHATKIVNNAGQIPIRRIRQMDENPKGYNLRRQSRPIEAPHPDLKPIPKVHGLQMSLFAARTHDYYHCWRNGSNQYKVMFRHLRQLLESEKEHDMSKAIWILTDMDISLTRRRLAANKDCIDELFCNFFKNLMNRISKASFWSKTDRYDDNLLIIADMIRDRDEWKEMTGLFPEDIIHKIAPNSTVSVTYSEMENIILSEGTDKPIPFYILAYRLREFKDSLTLCHQIDTLVGLDKIFFWNQNSGLCLDSHYTHKTKHIRIEDIPAKELYSALDGIASTQLKLSAHKSPPKGICM